MERDGSAIEASMLTVLYSSASWRQLSAIHLVSSSGFFDELSTESGMLARQRKPCDTARPDCPSIGYSGKYGLSNNTYSTLLGDKRANVYF